MPRAAAGPKSPVLDNPPEGEDHLYTVHITFVDGSQHFEHMATKDEANKVLAEAIGDPEVSNWTAYQVIKQSK